MGEVDVKMHVFLTSALGSGEWSDSRPGRFTLGERALGTYWIGGLGEPQNRPGWRGEGKRDSNSDLSVVQPAASRYTDCTTPALKGHNYLLTYVRSWALPEKLPIVQPFRKFPAILRNPKVHHRVHKSPPLVPILSQFDPSHPILSL
jgi:hypothetical protein